MARVPRDFGRLSPRLVIHSPCRAVPRRNRPTSNSTPEKPQTDEAVSHPNHDASSHSPRPPFTLLIFFSLFPLLLHTITKMLRTSATNLLRNGMVRSNVPLTRAASTVHAISKPTLANIEKRWEGMPLQEQADLWMALRDRMKGNWSELTIQEQKAGACF